MSPNPTHQSVLALDVEGFGDPHRDDKARAAIRTALYRLVEAACTDASVPWTDCIHEDCGDGILVIVPPSVSKVQLLDPLFASLSAGLADHNRHAQPAERIRLRLALHAGEVTQDEHGFSGSDVLLVFRLLDASQLRTALRQSPGSLAVIVSETIYNGIVRHRYRGIDPGSYHPVTVEVKRTRAPAWVHLPDVKGPPELAPIPEGTNHPRPRQLLPSRSDFVSRKQELHALDRVMAAAPTGTAPKIVAIVGPPGVGKTELALHWAHRVRSLCDDGQLYADLGGFSPDGPVATAEVLHRFLRALGVTAQQIPLDADEQAALYRTVTADLRLLVVLDDAISAAHVRPFLPAAQASLVVVTSRSRLADLTAGGTGFIEVGPLARSEGWELLARLVGRERISNEPESAMRLVELCGGLPIALCIIAARLTSRPHWTLKKAATDLVDERRRLAKLSFSEELSVQPVFDMSYRALTAPAAALYRLLGLHPGPEVGTGVAAAVIATSPAAAEQLIDELRQASLLDETSEDRYRFHDLIRLHAEQQAMLTEAPDDQATAMRRMVDWYLHTADLAGQVVTPHRDLLRRSIEHVPVEPVSFRDHGEALAWLEMERANLLSAAKLALRIDLPRIAWQLSDTTWGLFLHHAQHHEWMEFYLLAIHAARLCADRHAEAEAEDRLGLPYHAQGHNEEALIHMTLAAGIWHELGNRQRKASSVERFGYAYLDQGKVSHAITQFRIALAEYTELNDRRSVGLALINLGRALLVSGQIAESCAHLERAHATLSHLDVSDPYNSARALIALGRAETKSGESASARARLESAVVTMRSVDSPLGQADALEALAELHESVGDDQGYDDVIVLLKDLGTPEANRVLTRLRPKKRT